MLKIVLISLICIYFFIYFIIALETKKPFKTMSIYAVLGIISLAAIKITSRYSGINLPINGYTLGAAACFGIPGTITLLLLNLIFV